MFGLASCAGSPAASAVPAETSPRPPPSTDEPSVAASAPVGRAERPAEAEKDAGSPEPEAATLPLVPEAVANHFKIMSSGNKADLTRTATGQWRFRMSVLPRNAAADSWAGYCWEFGDRADGTKYETLVVEFSEVGHAEEMEFKLEQEDKRIQTRLLRYPTVGQMRLPLASYAKVRPAIKRFCLVLFSQDGAQKATDADVTLSRVWLE
jgi:hypothetical protein